MDCYENDSTALQSQMSWLFESLFCAMAWNPDVVSKDFHHCSFRELLLLSIHIACLQLCPPPHCVWMGFTWTCIWLQWEFWKKYIYFLLWRGPKGQYGNLSIQFFFSKLKFCSTVFRYVSKIEFKPPNNNMVGILNWT